MTSGIYHKFDYAIICSIWFHLWELSGRTRQWSDSVHEKTATETGYVCNGHNANGRQALEILFRGGLVGFFYQLCYVSPNQSFHRSYNRGTSKRLIGDIMAVKRKKKTRKRSTISWCSKWIADTLVSKSNDVIEQFAKVKLHIFLCYNYAYKLSEVALK